MKILGLFATAALALSLTGCGRSAVLQQGAAGPAEDETVVVLGVKPAGYRVMFFPGTEKNGAFVQSQWLGAAINGTPTDGYIVAKAKPGDLLGLTLIQPATDSIFLKSFTACGGSRALVIEVPRSQVVYLGDIEYSPQGARIGVHYASDLEAASKHLRARYPAVGGELRMADAKSLPVTKSCVGPPIYVPIYIRGK